jgi:hypothetical protein
MVAVAASKMGDLRMMYQDHIPQEGKISADEFVGCDGDVNRDRSYIWPISPIGTSPY